MLHASSGRKCSLTPAHLQLMPKQSGVCCPILHPLWSPLQKFLRWKALVPYNLNRSYGIPVLLILLAFCILWCFDLGRVLLILGRLPLQGRQVPRECKLLSLNKPTHPSPHSAPPPSLTRTHHNPPQTPRQGPGSDRWMHPDSPEPMTSCKPSNPKPV